MSPAKRLSPLGKRLFAATIAIGLIVISSLTALRGIITADRAQDRFKAELVREEASHRDSISESLWVYDKTMIKVLIEGIVASPYISYAAVADENGLVGEAGTRQESGAYELISEIQHDDEGLKVDIGVMTLQGDLGMLKSIAWSWLYDDLPILALGVVLVAALLYLYFEKMVTRRLETDAQLLSTFKLSGFDLPFDTTDPHSIGEISTLESSFNDLSQKLRESYRRATKARVAAEESEQRYEILFQKSPVPLCIMDFSELRESLDSFQPIDANPDMARYFSSRPKAYDQLIRSIRITSANASMLELVRAESAAQISQKYELIFPEETLRDMTIFFTAIIRGESRVSYDGSLRTLSDERKRVVLDMQVLPSEEGKAFNRVIVAFIDITERESAQEKLRANLREKEVLIRELFHRTKNNMQSIISLITFEAWRVEDEQFRSVLHSLETRVYSMSLVHRMLYEYNDLSRLSLAAYLREFTMYLSASEDTAARNIRFDLRMDEIEVTIDTALPLGLIVSELMGNSLRHAFPPGRGGVISVDLSKRDDDRIVLVVSDDGIGVGTDFDPEADGSAGIQLITSLAESQLGGKVEFSRPQDRGFSCTLVLGADLYEARV